MFHWIMKALIAFNGFLGYLCIFIAGMTFSCCLYNAGRLNNEKTALFFGLVSLLFLWFSAMAFNVSRSLKDALVTMQTLETEDEG